MYLPESLGMPIKLSSAFKKKGDEKKRMETSSKQGDLIADHINQEKSATFSG